MRLFCLPHAGGGATTFRSWNAAMPPFVQICPILLPGREMRRSETPFTQMEALVDAIAQELRPWLDMPYAIFGHSMGSLLAFEWVRRLQEEGTSMPAWLFLSGRAAPDHADGRSPLQSLPDEKFLEQLTNLYQGIPQEILNEPELMEIFLPILRADISVVESYRFEETEALDCPITVFAGMKDRSVTWDQLLRWKRQTRRRFAAQLFPGGHFYPQEPLLQTIAATLSGLLD
jgi:surfactin synthase thioesterase subunit